MTYTEIIKLLDAGYTREEILAMNEDETNKNSSGGGDPTDETNKNTSASDDQAKDTNEMSGLIAEMREAFSEMRKEFTAMNILNSRQPEEKKVDDIFANIINPARNDNKKGE